MKNDLLIKHLREKYVGHDTTNFNIFDYIHAFGSGLEALLYTGLFWPDFIEIDDMVLLKANIEDENDRQRLAETFEKYEKDRVKTEKAFNVIEVSCLFGSRGSESTDEEDLWLAELLVKMWHFRLQELYPNRSFVIKIIEPKETDGELSIIFYQKIS